MLVILGSEVSTIFKVIRNFCFKDKYTIIFYFLWSGIQTAWPTFYSLLVPHILCHRSHVTEKLIHTVSQSLWVSSPGVASSVLSSGTHKAATNVSARLRSYLDTQMVKGLLPHSLGLSAGFHSSSSGCMTEDPIYSLPVAWAHIKLQEATCSSLPHGP